MKNKCIANWAGEHFIDKNNRIMKCCKTCELFGEFIPKWLQKLYLIHSIKWENANKTKQDLLRKCLYDKK